MVSLPAENCPPERYAYLAASLTIWSKAGKMLPAVVRVVVSCWLSRVLRTQNAMIPRP